VLLIDFCVLINCCVLFLQLMFTGDDSRLQIIVLRRDTEPRPFAKVVDFVRKIPLQRAEITS
jgi:hypothetical protein